MANCGNAKTLKILSRQMGQIFFADAILAECRLILFQIEFPQPRPDVHRRCLQFGDACSGLSDRDAMSVQAKMPSPNGSASVSAGGAALPGLRTTATAGGAGR